MRSSATRSRLGALQLGALLALAAAWAGAQPIDPTLPQTRVVGRPAAFAAMMRIDPGRTGRTRTPLPARPRVLWRARAQGGIEHPVSVDRTGAIVISSSIAQVVQIDPHGRPAWTVRTGRGAPLTAPVILSDGTRVVVTPGPHLIGISASGHVRFKRALPGPDPSFVSGPLGLDNGGLALGLGSELFQVSPAGSVVSTARVREPVVAILERAASLLVVTNHGSVLSWRPPGAPARVGALGGEVDGWPALCSPHSLCASVDHHRLVELDLDSGLRHVRMDDANIRLLGSPAITSTRETRVATGDGLVLGHDAKGTETLRTALIPGSASPDGGAGPALSMRSTLPPLIVDGAGTLGFARPGLDAGVLTGAGELRAAQGTSCPDPVGVTPAGARRMVVACRSGLIWLVGDASKP